MKPLAVVIHLFHCFVVSDSSSSEILSQPPTFCLGIESKVNLVLVCDFNPLCPGDRGRVFGGCSI